MRCKFSESDAAKNFFQIMILSVYYSIKKICFRKDSIRKTGNPHVDKFNEASRKFEKDVDFINIMKTLKHSQLMYHVLLSDY